MKIKNITLIILTAIFAGIFYKKYYVKAQKDFTTLVVGTSADYPPYEFINTKTSQVEGFDIDVVTRIAQHLNKKIIIKNMPFTSLIFGLLSGEIDLIAAGMSPTPRRAKFVEFTDAYLDGDYFVVVSRKDKFQPKNLTDLVGKQVVVNSGHTAEGFMAKQEGVNLVRLKDISFGIIALQAGTADAFVCSNSVFRNIFDKKNNAEQFAVLSLHGTGEDCAFAAKKDNKPLVDEINQALALMRKDGALEQLKNKWNL